MINQELPDANTEKSLTQWHQGDFALGVGGFLFAGLAEGDELFDAEETTDNVIGLVAISQTCDIVRRTGGRDFVTVCPMVDVPAAQLTDVQKGRKPYFADIEHAGRTVFADLRRVMSVHKDLVKTWKRQTGFSDAGRLRFAAALERKFGQFAFPDDFDQAIKGFRNRVWLAMIRPIRCLVWSTDHLSKSAFAQNQIGQQSNAQSQLYRS